ncbi:MAG: hypothetical protein HF307_19460 [Ignavibacteria bacterium]|nr:hypothetical protein [Ignavibacteria bacterium]
MSRQLTPEALETQAEKVKAQSVTAFNKHQTNTYKFLLREYSRLKLEAKRLRKELGQ